MIIDIPKHLLKTFRELWESSSYQAITLEHLEDVTFICNNYKLNKKFKITKFHFIEEPGELYIKVSEKTLTPVQPGALDIRLELQMLSTSVLSDLGLKSYARSLYKLFNPDNKPLTLTFPELRFLWNYIRAYTGVLFAQEGNDFDINQIKEPFLQGLSVLELAQPNKNPDLKSMEALFNNYQTWYNSASYGTRWQDFVDEDDLGLAGEWEDEEGETIH